MRRLLFVPSVLLVLMGCLVPALAAQQRPVRPPTGGGGVGTQACGAGCGGGGGGEDTSPPEIWMLQPGGVAYTAYPTIELAMCDNHNLSQGSQYVTVNGVDRTAYFAWNWSSYGGCGGYATLSTSSVALSIGNNSINAYVCDLSGNCTSEPFTVYRYAGTPPTITLATRGADIRDYARCAMSCFAATYAQGTVPYFTMDTPRSLTLADVPPGSESAYSLTVASAGRPGGLDAEDAIHGGADRRHHPAAHGGRQDE